MDNYSLGVQIFSCIFSLILSFLLNWAGCAITARIVKKPITTGRYFIYCLLVNSVIMIIWDVLMCGLLYLLTGEFSIAGASLNFFSLIIWTLIGTSISEKTLDKRGFLIGGEGSEGQRPENQESIALNQDCIPKSGSRKLSTIVLSITTAVGMLFGLVMVVLYLNTVSLLNAANDKISEYDSLQDDYDQLLDDYWDACEKAWFMDDHIVFVGRDEEYYHKYDCPYLDLSEFLAYNTEAAQAEYPACPYCN